MHPAIIHCHDDLVDAVIPTELAQCPGLWQLTVRIHQRSLTVYRYEAHDDETPTIADTAQAGNQQRPTAAPIDQHVSSEDLFDEDAQKRQPGDSQNEQRKSGRKAEHAAPHPEMRRK